MIKDLFNEVNRIKDLLETDFVEISVKQHQIDVVFKQDNGINLEDLNKIKKVFEKNHTFETPYLTTFEEEFHFTIPQIEKKKDKKKPHLFMAAIQKMADEICMCPSLEYVISSFYVKCFLDKPGLYVSDLSKYNEILQDKGTLELHAQRPYLLYVYYGANDDINE